MNISVLIDGVTHERTRGQEASQGRSKGVRGYPRMLAFRSLITLKHADIPDPTVNGARNISLRWGVLCDGSEVRMLNAPRARN